MSTYLMPGVYRQDQFPQAAEEFRTGVPAFLGFATDGPLNQVQMLTRWPEFEAHFGRALPGSFLAYAVRGFFNNGGQRCYVLRLADQEPQALALQHSLDNLASLETIDLVCAPDIMRLCQSAGPIPPHGDGQAWKRYIAQSLEHWQLADDWAPYLERALRSWGGSPDLSQVVEMQSRIMQHCDQLDDRFAILDALPHADPDDVIRQRTGIQGTNGALYHPWIHATYGPPATGGFVPPCGHVAGIYARCDQRHGVHKAPANEIVEDVLDLLDSPSDIQQSRLNPAGVNCLRSFPGRGIRVWGARTLSADSAWRYINVRRLFLTAARWIERNLGGMAFEPNDARLWARIERELSTYFTTLLRRGALKGATPQEAFYVKCDAETNPRNTRDSGEIVAEIGLAPSYPDEFVIVRITHGTGGTSISASR